MKHWTSTNIFGSYMRIFNRKVSNVFLRAGKEKFRFNRDPW
jgi:hypothetical protein